MSVSRPVVNLTYEFYRAAKASTSCVMDGCGTRQNLQFHHVEPANKRKAVATIARYGTIIELAAELRKCVPLCETHHQMVHKGKIKGWLKGQFINGVKTEDMSAAGRYLPFQPFFTGLVPSSYGGLPENVKK